MNLTTIYKYIFIGCGILLFSGHLKSQNNLLDPDFGVNGIVSFHPDYYQEANKILLVNDSDYITVSVIHDTVFQFEDVILHRLNTQGDLVSNFGNNGAVRFDFPGMARSRPVDALVSGDSVIYILGMGLDSASSFSRFCISAFTIEGNVYSSFGSNGHISLSFYYNSELPASITQQTDGKILVAGLTYDSDTIPWEYPCIARLNLDGSLDNNFGSTGKQIYDLMYGNIIAAGLGTIPENTSRHVGGGYFQSVIPLNDGRIFCGGGYHNGSNYEALLVMINHDGTVDSSFSTGGKMILNYYPGLNQCFDEFLIQSNGKILSLMNYTPLNNNSHSDFHLFEFNPATHTLEDNNYDLNNTFDKAKGFVIDQNEKLWITGNMTYSNNFSAWYTSDFAFINSLIPASGFWQNNVAFDTDGKAWFSSNAISGHQHNASDIIIDGQNRIVVFGYTFKPSDPDFLSDLVLYRIENNFQNTVSAHENELQITVFPNPASDELNIFTTQTGNKKINLFDLSGRKILEKNFLEQELKLNLSAFSSGMYQLSLTTENSVNTQLIIVNK